MEILIVPLFSTFSLPLFRQLLLPPTISSSLPLVLSIPAAVRQKVEYRDPVYFHSVRSSHRKFNILYRRIFHNCFADLHFSSSSQFSSRLCCCIRLVCGIRYSIIEKFDEERYFSFVAVEVIL